MSESTHEQCRRELVSLRTVCGISTDDLFHSSPSSPPTLPGPPPPKPSSSFPPPPPSTCNSDILPIRTRSGTTSSYTSISSMSSNLSSNTQLTTPSSSYPLTHAPFPTPVGSVSPTRTGYLSFRNLSIRNGAGGRGTGGREYETLDEEDYGWEDVGTPEGWGSRRGSG